MKAIRLATALSRRFQCLHLQQITLQPCAARQPLLNIPQTASISTSVQQQARLEERFDSSIDDEIAGIVPERERITAAPEIDLDALLQETEGEPVKLHARPLPTSPSYFMRAPRFTDRIIELEALSRQYANLPTYKPGENKRVAWRPMVDFYRMFDEQIKIRKYARTIEALNRLYSIRAEFMPKQVQDAIAPFLRPVQPDAIVAKKIPIDKFGRALGVGRRKTSTARAWLVEGTGEVLVNGKSLVEAFARVHDRESVVWPLKSTGRLDKYNLWALVEGGGTTGQCEALTLAVGKALHAHEPALKPALRRAGAVTRDPRKVERKKPGKLGARKMPAWVKR